MDTPPEDTARPSGRSKRIWIGRAILAIGAVAGVLVCMLLWRPAIILGTPTKAIEYSIAGEAGSPWPGDCDRATKRLACSVSTSGGSGSAEYTLTMQQRGCWTATKTKGYEGADGVLPDELSECLSLWDWIRVRDPN